MMAQPPPSNQKNTTIEKVDDDDDDDKTNIFLHQQNLNGSVEHIHPHILQIR